MTEVQDSRFKNVETSEEALEYQSERIAELEAELTAQEDIISALKAEVARLTGPHVLGADVEIVVVKP